MATTITFPTINHIDDASASVSLKNAWADSWTSYPKLHCTRLTLAAGPGVSSARFHWRIGEHLWPQDRIWQTTGVLSVNQRSYVRVEVAGSGGRTGYDWTGVWHSVRMQTEQQKFKANGVESLLNVPCLDAAYVDSSPLAPGAPSYANIGLTFNDGGKANRSHARFTVNGSACYIFSDDDNGAYWSTTDIAEYLLAMAAPKKADGTVIFSWVASGLGNLPAFDQPVLPTHGRTYLSLLNSLVTRFRLTSWTCSGATITFFTFADSDISLTNTLGQTLGTIPANSSTVVFDISKDQSASSTLATEAAHVCDVVKVTGERRKSVYSLCNGGDGTLDKAWTTAQETSYLAGGTGEANYPPATEPRLREEWDAEARARDELQPVYRWFKPADNWQQKAGDGQGGLALSPIAINDDNTQFWIYPGELEFLPDLPFLTNYSYVDATIANNVAARKVGNRGNPSGDPPYEPLPVLAWIRTLDTTEDYWGFEQWVQMDQLAAIADIEPMIGNYLNASIGTTPDRRWSASVRPLRSSPPTIEIRASGEPQHVLAEDEFAARGDAVTGALDWKDIVVTVCSYDTRHVEVQYPETVTPVGEYVETLRIEAPGHELIYVVPGTMVGTYATRIPVNSTGGYLQDDRDQMKVIAQRAYEWHKTPRYSLGFSSGWVDGTAQIGQLVTQYVDATGTYSVGSVLTEITLNFPVSQTASPERPSASYVTAFGELDPIKVV